MQEEDSFYRMHLLSKVKAIEVAPKDEPFLARDATGAFWIAFWCRSSSQFKVRFGELPPAPLVGWVELNQQASHVHKGIEYQTRI